MRSSRFLPLFSGLALLLCGSSQAQTTQLLSRGVGGGQLNGPSGAYYDFYLTIIFTGYSITPDGRFIAYASEASNVVPGDNNGAFDVFRYDRQTGSTIRVSVGLGGAESNGDSGSVSISADGRYVAFGSAASNLVPGDTNGQVDVFVFDCQTGTTTLASVDSNGLQSNGYSSGPALSADGHRVAFYSAASNLVPGDTNGRWDIFVRDLQANTTTRVSVGSGGAQGDLDSDSWSAFSSDGRYVVFDSAASTLVAGDTNGQSDVFVHDLQTGSTIRASVDSSGAQGNGSSYYGAISQDGRYVAFISESTNLVPGGTNGRGQVFLHDLQGGTTILVSANSSGIQGNDWSEMPSISPDDRYVAYASFSSNLAGSDNNGFEDVFVCDLQTGLTSCTSVTPSGVTGDKDSLLYPGELVFGSNDRYVFFASAASNLVSGDTNNYFDIFVRDQQSGTTSRVSVQGPGFEGDNASMMPFLSDGAAYVAYVSYATNIVPVGNGTGQVYVRNVATGGTTLASVSTGGAQGDQRSFQPCVSADGRFVAFNSDADNLVPSDNNGTADVFFRDQQAGTTTRVNVGWNGAQSSVQSATVAMSSDGRYVAFDSPDPLVQGDTNSDFDVFVRDLQAGTIARASLGSSAAQGNGPSSSASLSADGRNVAFLSSASNLVSGDTNGAQDIFVRNLQAATTTRVSVATGGAQANGNSDSPNISPDGRYVAFTSAATNLVPGDTNGTTDIFVRDLQTGTTSRESVDSNGLQANGSSSAPAISRGGRFVVFVSAATNLVPGDTNAVSDVFLRDRLTGRTSRVSVNTAGTQGDQASEVYSYYGPPSVSTDGRLVVFDSWATNFAADDTNGVSDVFLRDRGNDAVFAPFCFGDGTGAACPCGNSGAAGHGCQNSAGTGGAILTGSGTPSLAADTVHFTSSGELPTSTSVLLSGPTPVNPVNYGDGLRCVGGTLKRLYTHSAAGGVVTMPQGTDLSVSARSAAQGDPLSVGSTRIYQVYYRDPSSTYCASPTGGTFNISNALAVVWGP